MSHFLLVYNRRQGVLLSEQTFDESGRQDALAARFEAELRFSGESDIEVVVLTAASRMELMNTHSRYFRSAKEMLAG